MHYSPTTGQHVPTDQEQMAMDEAADAINAMDAIPVEMMHLVAAYFKKYPANISQMETMRLAALITEALDDYFYQIREKLKQIEQTGEAK